MKADDLFSPGVKFMLVSHDNDCPGAMGDPLRCCCEPEVRMVSEAEYTAAMNQTQAQSRAARRAADRALSKAQRKGGKQ
jgi:hypothetical protein